MAFGIALLAGACGSSGDDASTSSADAASGRGGPDDEASTTAPDPTGAGGAAGTPSTGGPDICELLEGVDASTLLGEPAGEPQPQGTVCRVGPTDTASRGQLGLVVETERPDDNYETQEEVFGIDREVSDLGDAAFHSGSYLFVLEGATLFFLQVVRDGSLGEGVADDDLEAAARTVITNLQAHRPTGLRP